MKTGSTSRRSISGRGQTVAKPTIGGKLSNERTPSHCLSRPSWGNRLEHFRAAHGTDGSAVNRARRAQCPPARGATEWAQVYEDSNQPTGARGSDLRTGWFWKGCRDRTRLG